MMETGIPFSRLIDETYYQKSYAHNQILALALQKGRLYADGKLILSSISEAERARYGIGSEDMGEIVSELRNTSGTEGTAFLYEKTARIWKASLRSRSTLDVSRVAQQFGGGGHIRAAGCTLQGTEEEVKETIRKAMEEAL